MALNNLPDPPGLTEGFLLDPSSGDLQALPGGWRALAWSPDGASFLLSRGPSLGIVRLADTTRLEPLGNFPLPVHGAAWVGP